MSHNLVDPGEKAKTEEEAKSLRLEAWKRPKNKTEREAKRKERVDRVKEGQ